MKNEIKCLVCGKIIDGDKALEHTKLTGHNRWKILYQETKEEVK